MSPEDSHGDNGHACRGSHGGKPVNVQGENLVQPAMLLFLCEEALTVAELVRRLTGFGLNMKVEAHTVEHYLSYFIEEGYVMRDPVNEAGEPVYEITGEGKASFREWLPVLQKRRDQLAFILMRANDL
jgi:DNA-binding PadR family transcriptional regulator